MAVLSGVSVSGRHSDEDWADTNCLDCGRAKKLFSRLDEVTLGCWTVERVLLPGDIQEVHARGPLIVETTCEFHYLAKTGLWKLLDELGYSVRDVRSSPKEGTRFFIDAYDSCTLAAGKRYKRRFG